MQTGVYQLNLAKHISKQKKYYAFLQNSFKHKLLYCYIHNNINQQIEWFLAETCTKKYIKDLKFLLIN